MAAPFRVVQNTALLLLIFALGCSKSDRSAGQPAGNEEGAVRQAVTEFQAAFKHHDVDKLWSLLDSESQADAERAAKAIQGAYSKATPEQKVEREKALGLSGAELGALTGSSFLKTKRFYGKYDELADSKIDKVTVQGDEATVAYTEPDGDKEKLALVREAGQWKLTLPMPKAAQP